ncbi:Zinc finger protein [Pseudolycoriella hygida]|uniref:Zinc finger protein n=1 Tax=Pseudolycoriella hygida TaxID=35572 RepID=A0A9Q0MRY5_9DIPT|nr:Zinc finger protein [Pseudolycoriella hygida]
MSSSKMSEDEYDFDNVCRTCLSHSNDLQSVFQLCASSTLPVQLNSVIMSITKVEINLDDGMPQKICNLCKTAVHQAYLYKMKCEESDFKLRKYLRRKCQNLNIKEELQIFDQNDLTLSDDPFNPTIEVDINIHTDFPDHNIKTMSRQCTNVDDLVECTVCSKHVDSKTLSKHMKTHSEFRCATCDRTFAKQNHLNLHMQSHLKKEYRCDQCDEIFSNKKSLKTHETTFHPAANSLKRKSTQHTNTEKVYVQANYETFNPDNSKYDSDLEEQFEIVNGRYQCGKCAKSLVDKQTFKLHFRLHTGKNLKRCPICGTGFAKNNHLDRHVALHYGSTFKCNFCEDLFDDYKSFRLHTANHSSQGNSLEDGHSSYDVSKEPNQTKKTPRRLECKLCEKIFTKKSSLERHVKSHEKKDYQCNYCDDIFDNHKMRRLHMIEHVHKGDQKRGRPTKQMPKQISTIFDSIYRSGPNGQKYCECKLCDRSFNKIFALQQHLAEHLRSIESLAEIDFTQKLDLFEGLNFDAPSQGNETLLQFVHQQLSVGENKRFYKIMSDSSIELTLSDSETESDSEMCDESKAKYESYECSKCNQSFDRSWKIFAHMRDNHPTDEFDDKCAYCNRMYPNATLLTKHLRAQCENTLKPFSCTYCGVKFIWKSNCDSHVEKLHAMEETKPEKTYACGICEKTFFRGEHLERHKKIHIPTEKKFSCDLCKKKFNRKDNLKSHMRVHKEDKDKEDGDKHLCVYCGRSFSNSSNLIVHMRRHTGEKPYKCDLCDKGFPRSSDLQCHRRTHTGEKPCLCTICGKGFSRSNKLVRHMRIHTGIRPYKCTYCDRAFTQSNDLTLHIRRHTGDKPYVCGICGDRFIQGTALQTHRRLQGHFENNQPTPFSSISVNNPNRYTNANRVNRIGTISLNVDELIKQEKASSSTDAVHSMNVASSNASPEMTRSSTATYIPNGSTYLSMDVQPILAISHYQGYN